MTILLEPAIEVRLRERAIREGQEEDALANTLLASVLLSEESEKERALDQALLAAGLITHISPPRDPSKADRPRIVVQGEPVSETIIRERQ